MVALDKGLVPMAFLVRQTIKRWEKDGVRVSSRTPGAKSKIEYSKKWYGQGIPGMPRNKRVPLDVNKSTSFRMLDEIVRNAESGSTYNPKSKKVSLNELLVQFESDAKLGLASKGRRTKPNQSQLSLLMQRLRTIIDGCGWRTVDDVNSGERKLAQYLSGRVELPRSSGGLSHQSAVFYLAAAKRFAYWLSSIGYPVRSTCFSKIPGFDPANNRTHARRDISPEELGRLLEAARQSRILGGLSGVDRYHLYLMAFSTGFRAGELASLTPRNFDFTEGNPQVVLHGKNAKNKKTTKQPIPRSVANELKAFVEMKNPHEAVWPGSWKVTPVRILKDDLKAAGIAYRIETPEGPRYADFHSLRHSFITVMSKVPSIGVKVLQVLSRHSDPRLTMAVYSHVNESELKDSVNQIALPGKDKEADEPDWKEVALLLAKILEVTLGYTLGYTSLVLSGVT
jgi:integrase